MKLELERLPQFNLQKIFKFIDVNNYNFIDANQIKGFLKKQGYKKLTENNRAINSILRRLNKYRLLKVSFVDFTEAMSPIATNLNIDKFDPRLENFTSDYHISASNKMMQQSLCQEILQTSPFRMKPKGLISGGQTLKQESSALKSQNHQIDQNIYTFNTLYQASVEQTDKKPNYNNTTIQPKIINTAIEPKIISEKKPSNMSVPTQDTEKPKSKKSMLSQDVQNQTNLLSNN